VKPAADIRHSRTDAARSSTQSEGTERHTAEIHRPSQNPLFPLFPQRAQSLESMIHQNSMESPVWTVDFTLRLSIRLLISHFL
jgi:hypothetical protein